MRHLKLTVASIKRECLPPRPGETTPTGKPLRERVYWDTLDRGFGLRVRPCRGGSDLNASFVLQRDLNGKPVKMTIGRFGVWTPEQARKRARELTVQMDRGLNPNAEKRKARSAKLTLAQAVAMHVEDMRAKERSPVSIQLVLTETDKYLVDWLSRPLVEIAGIECRHRHKRLTDNHGPYMANRVIRHLRACWNTAARIHPDLPPQNPTRAVAFNKERARNNPITWEDLPAWWLAVQQIQRPIRRDLQLFYLFTGLRRNDGKSVRWEHVDFEASIIHRPRPKGGVDRAFTVPVSGFVLELLRRRHNDNAVICPDGDSGWVFPARNRKGEITQVSEPIEQRFDRNGRKLSSLLPSPHRLRRTFGTAGHEAFLRELDLKILMNHVRPEHDVTHSYVSPSVEHLRCCIEKISSFLLQKARAGHVGS